MLFHFLDVCTGCLCDAACSQLQSLCSTGPLLLRQASIKCNPKVFIRGQSSADEGQSHQAEWHTGNSNFSFRDNLLQCQHSRSISVFVVHIDGKQDLTVDPRCWIIQLEGSKNGTLVLMRWSMWLVDSVSGWTGKESQGRGLEEGFNCRLVKTEYMESKFSQWLCWGGANPLYGRIIWPSD